MKKICLRRLNGTHPCFRGNVSRVLILVSLIIFSVKLYKQLVKWARTNLTQKDVMQIGDDVKYYRWLNYLLETWEMLHSLGFEVAVVEKSDAQRWKQAQGRRAKEKRGKPSNILERIAYDLKAKLAHVDMAKGIVVGGGWLAHLCNHIIILSLSPWILFSRYCPAVEQDTSLDL